MKNIKFKLKNLTCPACIKLSRMKIAKISGIKEVKLDNIDGEVEVVAERDITKEEIRSALEGTGYEVA